MTTKHILAFIAVAALLGACQSQEDRIAFDGQYFRAKAKRIDGNFDQFTVSVKPVSASLDGAREAGRYEAIKYCVTNFGTSEIAWTVGPDMPQSALQIEKDAVAFQGTCPNR